MSMSTREGDDNFKNKKGNTCAGKNRLTLETFAFVGTRNVLPSTSPANSCAICGADIHLPLKLCARSCHLYSTCEYYHSPVPNNACECISLSDRAQSGSLLSHLLRTADPMTTDPTIKLCVIGPPHGITQR